MKKNLLLTTLLSIVIIALCVFVSFAYIKFANGLIGDGINSLNSLALNVLAAMFGIAVSIRFVAPLILKEKSKEGSDTKSAGSAPCVLCRYLNFAAWALFALCLSALIASPLADTAGYIKYAAVFGSLSVVCILVPIIPSAEKLSAHLEGNTPLHITSAAALVLGYVPAAGICTGIFGAVLSAAMLRDEKAPSTQCIITLTASIIGALISAALSVCFLFFLFS